LSNAPRVIRWRKRLQDQACVVADQLVEIAAALEAGRPNHPVDGAPSGGNRKEVGRNLFAIVDGYLINVRIAPLCGLKSGISRGQRRAIAASYLRAK
jgi:hypothetical protein